MHEMLMAAIAEFAQTIKRALLICEEGSCITVTATKGQIELECSAGSADKESARRARLFITNAFEFLKDISMITEIEYTLVLKKKDGKVLIKNSLSPKNKESQYKIVYNITVKQYGELCYN